MRITKCTLTLFLLLVLCGGAYADQRESAIALSFGAFFPQSSPVRDSFGSTWSRVSLNLIDVNKPQKWMFSPEIGSYRLSGSTNAQLYPVTVGFERGLNHSSKAQPYVTLRAGPYFGHVSGAGLSESNVGLNANAAVGVVFARRYDVEARYDLFSQIAGYNFDGLSLSAGIRLFVLK